MHSNDVTMIKDTGTVISQHEIADGIFKMVICTQAARTAKPGQFISIYSHDKSRLLPRPISICDMNVDAWTLTVVYRVAGEGTAEFSTWERGESLELIGPIGNGYVLPDANKSQDKLPYDFPENPRIIAIGGGIGIPPILGLAKSATVPVEAVLGYRNSDLFLLEEFQKAGARIHVATDDGSIGVHGTVLDAIKAENVTGNIIYACGPMPMLRGVKQYAEENGILCFLSLEERMACGVGACLGCVTKSKEKDEHSQVNNKRVCTEGPVFVSTEVLL